MKIEFYQIIVLTALAFIGVISTINRLVKTLRSVDSKNPAADKAFTLGLYVGQYIVDRHLPTLETDLLQTSTVINVPEEHVNRLAELESAAESDPGNPALATRLEEFRKSLDRFSPRTVDCRLFPGDIYVSEMDMAVFMDGVQMALWNSDCSRYGALRPSPGVIRTMTISMDQEIKFTRLKWNR